MTSYRLRALLAGVFAGVMLSLGRAPLGLDLFLVQAVDGTTAALFRAVPWLLLAGLVGRPARLFERAGVPVPVLVTGVAVGILLEAFGLRALWEPQTRARIALAILAAALGVLACLRRPDALLQSSLKTGAPPQDAPGVLEAAALFAGGLGVALALSCLAYHLRHLGLATSAEASLAGLVLAALVAFGAAAFGSGRSPAGAALLAGGLPLAAGASFASAVVVHGFTAPGGLERYVGAFGMSLSEVGMLGYTALTAAVVFVAPALIAGAALGGARHRRRLSAVLLGAGAGVAAWPIAADAAAGAPKSYAELFEPGSAWTCCMLAGATWIAVLGGGAAALLGCRGRARWLALAAVLAAAAAPFAAPRRAIWILSPWHRVPVEPELAWNTGHGLLTVEPVRDGARVVTLDRRRLTALGLEEDHERRQVQDAFARLPAEKHASGTARVLLIGQITPALAFTLQSMPAQAIDHCVPWHSQRAPVDAALFDGEPVPEGAIAPREARARLERGSYDLVLVLPAHGPLILARSASEIPWAPSDAPATAGWSVPKGTLAVVWLEAASPIAGRDLGRAVVLTSRGVDDLGVGVVLGGPPAQGEGLPTVFDPGPPGKFAGPLARLRERPLRQHDRARSELFARLARAHAEDGALSDLLSGLLLHTAAQVPSSPFETLAEQVEIDDGGLELLARSAAAGLDPFQRNLWEGLAELLVGKRMPDKVLRLVQPLAERYPRWPALERAVAAAYRELLMPAEAAAWLRRALESEPYAIDLLVEAAETAGLAGDSAAEIELLERALAIQPGRFDLEKLLVLAHLRAGAPGAEERVRALLAEHPDDEELAEALRAGPWPSPPSSPSPSDEHGSEDGD